MWFLFPSFFPEIYSQCVIIIIYYFLLFFVFFFIFIVMLIELIVVWCHFVVCLRISIVSFKREKKIYNCIIMWWWIYKCEKIKISNTFIKTKHKNNNNNNKLLLLFMWLCHSGKKNCLKWLKGKPSILCIHIKINYIYNNYHHLALTSIVFNFFFFFKFFISF